MNAHRIVNAMILTMVIGLVAVLTSGCSVGSHGLSFATNWDDVRDGWATPIDIDADVVRWQKCPDGQEAFNAGSLDIGFFHEAYNPDDLKCTRRPGLGQ